MLVKRGIETRGRGLEDIQDLLDAGRGTPS